MTVNPRGISRTSFETNLKQKHRTANQREKAVNAASGIWLANSFVFLVSFLN